MYSRDLAPPPCLSKILITYTGMRGDAQQRRTGLDSSRSPYQRFESLNPVRTRSPDVPKASHHYPAQLFTAYGRV